MARPTFHLSTSHGGGSFYFSEKSGRKSFAQLSRYFASARDSQCRVGTVTTITLDSRLHKNAPSADAVVLDTITVEAR